MKARSEYLFDKAIILHKRPGKTVARKEGGIFRSIVVRARPGNPARGLLSLAGLVFPCALGRGGIGAFKREGDGATPLATMKPLGAYLRTDRRPAGLGATSLPKSRIRADLGWCDAPGDPNYNRPVRLPYAASRENMLREDRLYDVCVVLDWNMIARRRGCGSAIFLHLAHPGMKPTEGCIAVAPRTMARLLPLLSRQTRIVVRR